MSEFSSLGKREKWVQQAIVCITQSFRGEKVDKREEVGDEAQEGRRDRKKEWYSVVS